jgi:acyl-CoA synthetase (AMP-forming)/AMP-acid ligase II
MSLRLLAQLDRHAAERPAAPAISPTSTAASVAAGAALTWAELRDLVAGFAAVLAGRTAAGDVLLLCAPNRAEFTVAFLAALRAGLRVFPLSPSMTAAELSAAAVQTAARVAVGTPAALAAVRAVVPVGIAIDDVPAAARDAASRPTELPGRVPPRDPAAAALLLHSSGTTGLPKIVVRSARSLDAVAEAMAEAIGFGPADRVLACVPLCHSYGVEHGLLAPTWGGSAVRLCQGFDLPTVTAELDAGATIFPGVPFVYETLARQAAGRRYPRLRRAYSAGGPLPDAVRDAVRDHLGVAVTQLYGATEIGSVTYADPDRPEFAPASVGRPMRGVDVRVLPPGDPGLPGDPHSTGVPGTVAAAPLPAGEQGHVAVRADSMFDGYLDRSRGKLPDGYFATGDLGFLDAAGNLTLTGRLKLLIDVAGLKVNPLEVEAALGEHPAVAACVVVPLVVTETVSRLKAVVVRAAARRDVSGEDLRQYLRGRLAPHKVPRVFEFRDDLPRSAAGKVLRQQVE